MDGPQTQLTAAEQQHKSVRKNIAERKPLMTSKRTTPSKVRKKIIITVVEPMYIEILNDDLVGFANTTWRYMIYHLFLSYGSITAVDIEQNFENMRKAWDPQQPFESLFKKIQDCDDFAEAGGVAIGVAQKNSPTYSKITRSYKI
jgi:hypothetical protein